MSIRPVNSQCSRQQELASGSDAQRVPWNGGPKGLSTGLFAFPSPHPARLKACSQATGGHEKCVGAGSSNFNREAFQITQTTIRAKLEVDVHFCCEHRYKQHHHSELIHNLVMYFAVFDIWIESFFSFTTCNTRHKSLKQKPFVLNFLRISYIHSSHLCSHSNVPLSFPYVEPRVFWSTEMTAIPNQH